MTRSPSFPPFLPTSGTLIRTGAERWGDRPFVTLGDHRLTYGEAERASARLAKGLLVSGVGKGTHVGLLAPNSPEWVVGWLAATRIGAVVALLNTYNKTTELRRTIRHADLQLLLAVGAHLGHDYLDRLEEAAPGLVEQDHEHIALPSHPYLRSVWTWGAPERRWCGDLDGLAARGDAVDEQLLVEVESEVTPADAMEIVYSSGSTADPKGAVHSHGATVRHAHNLNQMRDLQPDDVLYTPMPLFWVGGFSFTLVAAMHVGASLVFEEQFEPGATLDLIERERVTRVLGWPHMAKALVDHPSFADRDLSSIRAGNVTALLPQDQQVDADVPKATSLGMSETLGPHTFADATPLTPEQEGSFGFIVPGVEHRIVDPVTLEDLPVGQIGEVWVRGYSVTVGLHKRERADTFTPDGWYRTGDAGRFDEDGHFYFTGRMGDLIKSSGMNITPREVEVALEELPEVVMAFVTGIDHPDRGQDVVAAIALRSGEALDGDVARTRIKGDLASYKLPRRIAVFADQKDLPWLDSGKVDRRRLAAILEERFGPGSEAAAP
ncbi:class I adenylate-forming enzyme family protein [Aquihabitans sp. McL0605]|uniref:class I adenylate-forming enzyme family protein n=1 Tax=Aquihabitans sp. McL0605 TaxID=3415671 RepID=UPI003CFB01B8